MNLIASLIVRNERGRYLDACIDHLLDFCDKVVMIDDGSTDHTFRHVHARLDQRIHIEKTAPTFRTHEGRARQRLLNLTLEHNPTHVLSLDADEFVSDGSELRARIEAQPDVPVWTLAIEEVWVANELGLGVREDGGWRTHPLYCCWKAPERPDASWKIRDKALACQRVPMPVLGAGRAAKPSGVSLLHFGWADPLTRKARFDYYMSRDGGRFHARRHIQSCGWDVTDPRVKLRPRPWPPGETFDHLRERLTMVAA